MPSWAEFKERAAHRKDSHRWSFTGRGYALYTGDSGDFHLFVSAPVDPEWVHHRTILAKESDHISFSVFHEIGKIRNDGKCLRNFAVDWHRMWAMGCCPSRARIPELKVMDPMPERLVELKAIQLNDEQWRFFREKDNGSSALRMLFGQLAASLCEEGTYEAGHYICPFCGAEGDGVSGYGFTRFHMHNEEKGYFQEDRPLLACVGCGRVLDISG